MRAGCVHGSRHCSVLQRRACARGPRALGVRRLPRELPAAVPARLLGFWGVPPGDRDAERGCAPSRTSTPSTAARRLVRGPTARPKARTRRSSGSPRPGWMKRTQPCEPGRRVRERPSAPARVLASAQRALLPLPQGVVLLAREGDADHEVGPSSRRFGCSAGRRRRETSAPSRRGPPAGPPLRSSLSELSIAPTAWRSCRAPVEDLRDGGVEPAAVGGGQPLERGGSRVCRGRARSAREPPARPGPATAGRPESPAP